MGDGGGNMDGQVEGVSHLPKEETDGEQSEGVSSGLARGGGGKGSLIGRLARLLLWLLPNHYWFWVKE